MGFLPVFYPSNIVATFILVLETLKNTAFSGESYPFPR